MTSYNHYVPYPLISLGLYLQSCSYIPDSCKPSDFGYCNNCSVPALRCLTCATGEVMSSDQKKCISKISSLRYFTIVVSLILQNSYYDRHCLYGTSLVITWLVITATMLIN